MIATLALVLAGWLAAVRLSGQTSDRKLRLGGTIRAKYEWQTREDKGRFQVRTARLNVAGQVNPAVSYKAEVDLCDEGEIKMLDAYVAVAGGRLVANDCKRGRLTGGFTVSLDRPFLSDIRVNYEKYFYGRSATPKPSERDKIVVELMAHF